MPQYAHLLDGTLLASAHGAGQKRLRHVEGMGIFGFRVSKNINHKCPWYDKSTENLWDAEFCSASSLGGHSFLHKASLKPLMLWTAGRQVVPSHHEDPRQWPKCHGDQLPNHISSAASGGTLPSAAWPT